eukprot:COSAG02_NODE_30932_length_542_cov_1.155756_1_plen_61_part_00
MHARELSLGTTEVGTVVGAWGEVGARALWLRMFDVATEQEAHAGHRLRDVDGTRYKQLTP